MSDRVDRFEHGRALFRAGEPCPENIWRDEEWRGRCQDGQIVWLGWMVERGLLIMQSIEIENWAREVLDQDG